MTRVKLSLMVLAAIMCWAPAFAQSTAGAPGPLRVGQKYHAVQSCHYQNDGVVFEITSVTNNGTSAAGVAQVNCWHKLPLTSGNRYRNGNLEIVGGTARFRFLSHDLRSGLKEWVSGTVTQENGRMTIRFPAATLMIAGASHETPGMIFVLQQ